MADERDRMVGAAARRIEVGPHVRRAGLSKHTLAIGAADGDDDRQLVDGRGAVAGGADELGIFAVGHRLHAEVEVVDLHAVHGTFVFLSVHRSHEKTATRHERSSGK